MKHLLFAVYLGAIIIGTTVMAIAVTVLGNDSAQSRKRPVPPIIDGSHISAKFDRSVKQTGNFTNPYHQWVGNIITHVMRDPAFLASLDVNSEDFKSLIITLDSAGCHDFPAANTKPDHSNNVNPLLVGTGVCQRCHTTPTGWGKDYSELPIAAF